MSDQCRSGARMADQSFTSDWCHCGWLCGTGEQFALDMVGVAADRLAPLLLTTARILSIVLPCKQIYSLHSKLLLCSIALTALFAARQLALALALSLAVIVFILKRTLIACVLRFGQLPEIRCLVRFTSDGKGNPKRNLKNLINSIARKQSIVTMGS